MAIMLITHNLGVVAEMADDVVVMYLGRVVEKGPVDEIFYNPKHPYTQALLKSIPSVNADAAGEAADDQRLGPAPVQPARAGCPFHPRCPSFMPGHVRRARATAADPSRATSRTRAASCTAVPAGAGGGEPVDATAARMHGPSAGRHRDVADRSRDPRAMRCWKCERLKKFFPIQEGLLAARSSAHVRAVDDVSFFDPAGRDAGAGRRERLRQDDHRPLRPARDRPDRRRDAVHEPSNGSVVDVAARAAQPACGRCAARCR